MLSPACLPEERLHHAHSIYIVSFVIGERLLMYKNPTSRRSFLKASTLTASALALRGPGLLAQSTQADAHIEILPGEAIDHHLA